MEYTNESLHLPSRAISTQPGNRAWAINQITATNQFAEFVASVGNMFIR